MTLHEKTIPGWNIIFLIYAELVDDATAPTTTSEIGNVKAELKKLETDLLTVQSSDNFNLFTIKNPVQIKDDVIISDTTSISRMVSTAEGQNSFELLKELSIQDFIQKGEEIRNAFQYIDENYPAGKTLLITWDHGSVFGIFKKVLRDKIEDISFSKLYEVLSTEQSIKNKFTGEDERLCMVKNKKFEYHPDLRSKFQKKPTDTEDTITDILTNDELARAITYGFKSKCVDVLIMFNCDMQNMQSCYAFSSAVKYLVAPQDTIASPGYDYVSIIDLIGANGALAVDGAMVAACAVNTIKQFFINNGSANKIEQYAIFAVSLNDYEKVIKFMQLLGDKLISLSNDEKIRNQICNERSKCHTYGIDFGYNSVDVGNFLTKLITIVNDADLVRLTEYLKNLYNSLIIARAVGNNVYSNAGHSWEQLENIPPKGVTIYYPVKPPHKGDIVVTNFISPGAKYFASLMAAVNWGNVLNKVYKKTVF
jgi:hypothetical protein